MAGAPVDLAARRRERARAELDARLAGLRMAIGRASADCSAAGTPPPPALVARLARVMAEYGSVSAQLVPRDLLSGLPADPAAVERAVDWLERDPFCLDSGYGKQMVMRRLRVAPLTEQQQDRLRAVLVTLTRRGPRQEFAEALRLARRLSAPAWTAELLDVHETAEDARVRWAAGRLYRAAYSVPAEPRRAAAARAARSPGAT